MERRNKRLVALMVTVLILGSSLATSVLAADNMQNLKGFFSSVITIFNNGQQVSLGYDDVSGAAFKPLVINNRTYIPVRALSEVLGKDVEWTQASNRIDISDKPDANYNYVLQQLIEKQEEIAKLEKKVKELEAELESKKSSISTLKDLEKHLNSEHGKYRDVRFDISLSGSTKNMTVKIAINRNDNSDWNKLTDARIKEYVEDVVKDILYEFKDAKVEGYIRNEYTNKDVKDFYVNNSGRVVVENSKYSGGSGWGYDLQDLEDYLNYNYSPYYNVDFRINLSWSNNDIRADIDVYNTDWYNMGSYNQSEFLRDICRVISSDFPNEYISGYVYDNYSSYGGYSFSYDSWNGLRY